MTTKNVDDTKLAPSYNDFYVTVEKEGRTFFVNVKDLDQRTASFTFIRNKRGTLSLASLYIPPFWPLCDDLWKSIEAPHHFAALAALKTDAARKKSARELQKILPALILNVTAMMPKSAKPFPSPKGTP